MSKRGVVRSLLLAVGVALLAYAWSDHPFYGGEPGYGKTEWVIGSVGLVVALGALLPVKLAEAVLLGVLSSFVALGAVELGAGVLLSARYRPIYQADTELIFKFIPGRTSEFTHSPANGGAKIIHRINSDGFRGPEFSEAEAATRVVVYGDSFIHAFYTPDDLTFTAKLAEHLTSRLDRKVDVINAGVSSYGPDQIVLKMARELPQLKPDLVVVAVFAGNDFGDLLRNKLFRVGSNGQLEDNAWTLDPAVATLFEISQRESILKRALREASQAWSPTHGSSALSEEAASPAAMLDEAEAEYRSYLQNAVVTNTHVDHYSADISLTPERESARLKATLMQLVLERIQEVGRAQGVPILFLFIPHPGDLPGQYAHWHVDRARFPQYDGRRLTDTLERIGRAHSMFYVNLYDVFGSRDPNSLYLRGDDHWNEVGQDLAAGAVAGFIADQDLLRSFP